jgi:hypothetical protein
MRKEECGLLESPELGTDDPGIGIKHMAPEILFSSG